MNETKKPLHGGKKNMFLTVLVALACIAVIVLSVAVARVPRESGIYDPSLDMPPGQELPPGYRPPPPPSGGTTDREWSERH